MIYRSTRTWYGPTFPFRKHTFLCTYMYVGISFRSTSSFQRQSPQWLMHCLELSYHLGFDQRSTNGYRWLWFSGQGPTCFCIVISVCLFHYWLHIFFPNPEMSENFISTPCVCPLDWIGMLRFLLQNKWNALTQNSDCNAVLLSVGW